MTQNKELHIFLLLLPEISPDSLWNIFCHAHLPDNLEPINILVIGYSDDEPADTNRFDTQRIPMSQLVSYENL